MTDSSNDSGSDGAMLERDIDRTQDRIGETVQKIEDKLTPSEVTRSVLGDDGQAIVRDALRMVRENPIPAAMVAVGAIWLLAGSGAPTFDRLRKRLTGKGPDGLIPRSAEPAPIGPPPATGGAFDRRASEPRER